MSDEGTKAYADSRRHAYVEQPDIVNSLQTFVETRTIQSYPKGTKLSPLSTPSLPLLISGEPGSGKSALLAYWSTKYRTEHPEAFLITHYINATPSSSDVSGLLLHIIEEIRDRYNLQDTVPTDTAHIVEEFPLWLGTHPK